MKIYCEDIKNTNHDHIFYKTINVEYLFHYFSIFVNVYLSGYVLSLDTLLWISSLIFVFKNFDG